MKIINKWKSNVKNDNSGLKFCEGTAVPFWVVIDPKQMLKPDCHSVAYMVKGVFFSRESAERWLKANRHNLGKNPVAYCMSAVGTDLEEILGEE